jgi:hypothetical protein
MCHTIIWSFEFCLKICNIKERKLQTTKASNQIKTFMLQIKFDIDQPVLCFMEHRTLS